MYTHRKTYNPQAIQGAHGPVPNQPIAGPENPHGNTSGRHHEIFVRRQNHQRRQAAPEETPILRLDFTRPGHDQPGDGLAIRQGPAPAEDPARPIQMTAQNGSPDVRTPPNTPQPVMPKQEGRTEADEGNADVDEGYEADDEE